MEILAVNNIKLIVYLKLPALCLELLTYLGIVYSVLFSELRIDGIWILRTNLRRTAKSIRFIRPKIASGKEQEQARESADIAESKTTNVLDLITR